MTQQEQGKESDAFTPSRRSVIAAGAGLLALAGCKSSGGRANAGSVSDFKAFRGKARTPLAQNEIIRVGIIGAGGPGGCAMGLGHALSMADYNAKGQEKVEIVCVSDVNDLHAAGAKEAIEAKQKTRVDTCRDHRELLRRDDIHAVVNATPEHWHAQVAIDAMAAGKDVYTEKPMTLNLADAVAMYRMQQANPDLIVQVGTQMTRMPKFHEARKLVKAGAIGTPTFSQTSYCRNSKHGEWHYTIDPRWQPGVNLDWERWCGPLGSMPWDPKVYYQWRRYPQTSTGIIGDLLVHVMTPLMLAIDQGWPVRVSATGGHLVDKQMKNPDNVNIIAQFETGHQMMVAGSTCNEAGLETMIRGHEANIYLNSRHCVVRPERVYAEDVDEKTVECPDIGNDQDVHRLEWLKSLRTREQPVSNVELGLKVMVIVDLATRSIWEGGSFRFDPKTFAVARG